MKKVERPIQTRQILNEKVRCMISLVGDIQKRMAHFHLMIHSENSPFHHELILSDEKKVKIEMTVTLINLS
jgi:hypothetical protein